MIQTAAPYKVPSFFEQLDNFVLSISSGDFDYYHASDDAGFIKNDSLLWVRSPSMPADKELEMACVSTMLSQILQRQVLGQDIDSGQYGAQALLYNDRYYFVFRWPDGQEMDCDALSADIEICKRMMTVSSDNSINMRTKFDRNVALNVVEQHQSEMFIMLVNTLHQYKGMPPNDYFSMADVIMYDRPTKSQRKVSIPIVSVSDYARLTKGEDRHLPIDRPIEAHDIFYPDSLSPDDPEADGLFFFFH